MRADFWILLLAAILFCGVCMGQTLTISNAPFAPATQATQAGVDIVRAIGAFRFAASGGAVDVTAISFALQGTGNWATDCGSTDGFQIWRDDGDGVFGTPDVQLFVGGVTGSSITVPFSPSLTIPNASNVDLWIVTHIPASTGQSLPKSFSTAIVNPSDTTVSGSASVQFGTPVPTSTEFSIVLFFVTTFSPLQGRGGQDITITGSGLTPPVSVTIAGVFCTGTASVNGSNTVVTGLTAPGPLPQQSALAITITTGLLGPITLTQTWDGDTHGGHTGPDCSTSENTVTRAPLGLAVSLAILLVPAFRKLRRRILARRTEHEA